MDIQTPTGSACSNQRSESQSNTIEPSSRKSNSKSGSYRSKKSEEKSVIKDESQNEKEESKIIENSESYCKHESKAQSWEKEIVENWDREQKNKNVKDYQPKKDRGSNPVKIRRWKSSEVSRKNSSCFQENSKVEQFKIMDEPKFIDNYAKIL